MTLKTEEVETMRISGKICSEALKKVLSHVRVGVSTRMLDDIARAEIERQGAKPSFMTVEHYKYTICTTINDQVVHGIPTKEKVKEGDILGIDIGALYKGYHSDMSLTIPIGSVTEEVKKFLNTGKETLIKAIAKAQVGNRIGDISETIQKMIEGAGYSIVKSLTGHGVGRKLHEEPFIPGFGKKGTGPLIKKNMVLAIEVIYAQGSGEVKLENDGWTISTKDGSLASLWEQTVAIKETGPIVLTPYL